MARWQTRNWPIMVLGGIVVVRDMSVFRTDVCDNHGIKVILRNMALAARATPTQQPQREETEHGKEDKYAHKSNRRRGMLYSKGSWLTVGVCAMVLVSVSLTGTVAVLSKQHDRAMRESTKDMNVNIMNNHFPNLAPRMPRSNEKADSRVHTDSKPIVPSKDTAMLAVDAADGMPNRKTSNSTFAFVHIGKTGGSTLSSMLRNGCNSIAKGGTCNRTIDPATESTVSKLVEHYYHVPDFWRLPNTNHKAYIITARDVYDRTLSAFLYQHPKNAEAFGIKMDRRQEIFGPEAYKCFSSLDDFAGHLSTFHKISGTIYKHEADQYESSRPDCKYPYQQNEVSSQNCASMACAALHGDVRFFTHLFFNFRNIMYLKLPPGRQVYVVRQEFLWDDWNDLNRMLGADPAFRPSKVEDLRDISRVKAPVTRTISTRGRAILCRSLESEYAAYFGLLRRAKNMSDAKLQESLRIAQRNCPNLDMKRLSKG